MRRLTDRDELLDGPLDDTAVVRGNLHDLARVNRRLGGTRLSIAAIGALAGGARRLDILDVGTGGADIPLALLDHAGRVGSEWRVIGVDSRPEILAAAVAVEPRLTATAGLILRVGDGTRLDQPDASVDVTHASLVVHHLAPDDVDALLREMVRVARLGIVVNDLVRGRWSWIGAWLMSHLLTGNHFTRHDAPMSVRRAYTVAELTALVAAAGFRVERRFDGPFGHRVALVARRNGRS